MFENYKKIMIFDTETSSLSPDSGEILEFGGLLLEKEEGSSKFTKVTEISELIKNKMAITNSHIHHITEDMCQKDGIEKEKMFNILKDIFGQYSDILLIAYNSPFDMRFVKAFMEQMSPGYKIENKVLDLLEVAKDRTMTYRGNKLCDMIVRYSITGEENSHRAIADVKATFEVMKAMMRERNNLEDYIR